MTTTESQYRPSAGLLPDPPTAERHYTVISVDDHVVEPGHTFEGRLPKKFADLAPRLVDQADGSEQWEWEGVRYPQIAIGATAGRPKDEWNFDAMRLTDIRPSCYDAAARVKDMDIDGVYASVNFASLIAGFAGGLFYRGTKNAELGHALVKAWNDWQYEEWISPYPDRFIGSGITWLGDPHLAAEEVRRNAARGFKAVSFVEHPVDYGLPNLQTDYWDPLFRACEETETVMCLHVGSSGWNAAVPGSPVETTFVLFPLGGARVLTEWLFAGVPCRFPRLQIALSEGGIGWVPMIMERIDYVLEHGATAAGQGWQWPDAPRDVIQRNFNFCSIEFGSGIDQRNAIGVDRIMIETDFPHADSSWPNTQSSLVDAMRGLSDEEVRKITWGNASRLFRHPVPADLQIPAQRP